MKYFPKICYFSAVQRFFGLILSFILLFPPPLEANEGPSLEEFKAKYPSAVFKTVTLEEYQRLYARNDVVLIRESKDPKKKEKAAKESDVCKREIVEDKEPGETYGYWMLRGSSNWGSSDGKDVLIVIAIIGVVVVAALVVYSLTFLAQAAANGFKCRKGNQYGLRFSYIIDETDTQLRRGSMTGAYLTSAYQIPIGTMGLTFELGHLSMDLRINETNQLEDFEAPYLLAGPSFNLPVTKETSFHIELLAGSATDKGIGLMSTLRLGFGFDVGRKMNLGVSFGGALIRVKKFKGFLTDLDQFNYLPTVDLSYQF